MHRCLVRIVKRRKVAVGRSLVARYAKPVAMSGFGPDLAPSLCLPVPGGCHSTSNRRGIVAARSIASPELLMKTYMCLICGWIYDEALGAPDHGIAPGTPWAEVPMNWTCPECGARKEDFEMVPV